MSARWIVTLAASGEVLGRVEADTKLEALGAAVVLATASGRSPQRVDVALEGWIDDRFWREVERARRSLGGGAS